MKKYLEPICILGIIIGIVLFLLQFVTKEGVKVYPISEMGTPIIIICSITYTIITIIENQKEIIKLLKELNKKFTKNGD